MHERSDTCLFCEIAAGPEPSVVVHEDDACLAFMNIHPLGEAHVLVIPKSHARQLAELDASARAHVFDVADRVVRAQRVAGFGVEGTNWVLNDGRAANQHIPHGGSMDLARQAFSASTSVATAAAVVHYWVSIWDAEQESLECFVDALGPGADEAFMTYADALREESWQKGEAAIVLRLLSRKSGELPADVSTRVRSATSDELERWADELLTAGRLEDVFKV